MTGQLREAAAILRGSRPGSHPRERAMLWAIVVVQGAGLLLVGYLAARNIAAGWPW